MVARHNWTTAYVNGAAVRSSSHALEFFRALDWSIAASFSLFGVSDWSARLPLSLCVLATAVLAFFFGRKLFGWNAAGLYASLIFLCWPGTFLATRELTAAPLLCLETALIAFALWELLVVRKIEAVPAIGAIVVACALILLTGRWPSVVLPIAIGAACWFLRSSKPPANQVQLVLIAWAACAFIFAAILEPEARDAFGWLGPVPPIALLASGWLAAHEAFASPAAGKRVARYLFTGGLGAAAVAIFFALHGPVGFNAEKQSVAITAGATRIPSLIAAAALLTGVIGNLIYRLRNNPRVANCFLAGMLGGLVVAVQAGLVISSPLSSSQILADAIRPELNPTDIVIVDGKYPEASSFAFYLERPVLLSPSPSAGPSAQPSPVADDAAAINQAWASSSRVFLWTKAGQPAPVPGNYFLVASSGGKEVLSNEPNSSGAAF